MFMVISAIGFTTNDAIVKYLVVSMNTGQMMFVRGVFATGLIFLLARHHGAFRNLRHLRDPMVMLRVTAEVAATLVFLTVVAHMPLANFTAVMQMLPLAVTMAAALFLGEKVGWRRWLAILAGLAGVLIIIRPGFAGFTIYSVMALLCVMGSTVRDLATRRLPADVPTLLVTTATAGAVAVVGGALIVPLGGWTPMGWEQVGLMFVASVLMLFGFQFAILAMRTGEISFIVPFRYAALLWAMVLGFVVFGDVPDTAMIAGSAIVVCAGLYSLYRERTLARRQGMAAPSRSR